MVGERHISGIGQHVSVSAQQAITLAIQGNILSAAVGDNTVQRIAGGNSVIEGARIHFSRSKTRQDTSAPTFNRDMMYVLNQALGYEHEKIGDAQPY